jgi:hypothetical protein
MARKRAAPAIPDIIAERVFERADGRKVRALVGRPREGKGKWKREWVCEFQILGVGHSKVYALPGVDSFEALQLALGMMMVQLESYQKEHGLTFLGDSYLGLMKPDVEAMRREIEASPDFPLWRHVLNGLWLPEAGG